MKEEKEMVRERKIKDRRKVIVVGGKIQMGEEKSRKENVGRMSRRKKNGDGRGKKVKGGKNKIRGCKGRKKEEDMG